MNVTEKKIMEIYNKVFNEVFNTSNIQKLQQQQTDAIRLQIISRWNSNKYNEFCKKFAKELADKGIRHQRGLWRKYYRAAKASHIISLPKTFNMYEANVMTKAIQHNFKMIKSIPEKVLDILNHKYMSTLIEEVAKGNLSRGSFKKQLESHGHKNAKLIARTESAKLQTAILEQRAVDLGSVAYIWLASKDKRTRPSHRNMDGVVVFWNQMKPLLDGMTGHAGEFPNCRCTPQPILDSDDLTKSSYKVYDYRNNNIITMSRKDLIQALKAGKLQ